MSVRLVLNQGLGWRLRQHRTDRHNGRWDRCSWLGMLPAHDLGPTQQCDRRVKFLQPEDLERVRRQQRAVRDFLRREL